MTTVMVSGGFDPLHQGHVQMIRGAARLGQVLVVLNSDAWLLRKKGFVFQPWAARAEILSALRYVNGVTWVDDEDGTVCEAIERIGPDLFVNGGDRTVDNVPEVVLCKRLGIKTVFGLGGQKVESSSALVARAREAMEART